MKNGAADMEVRYGKQYGDSAADREVRYGKQYGDTPKY